jgi:hypothetical protein
MAFGAGDVAADQAEPISFVLALNFAEKWVSRTVLQKNALRLGDAGSLDADGRF